MLFPTTVSQKIFKIKPNLVLIPGPNKALFPTSASSLDPVHISIKLVTQTNKPLEQTFI